MLTVPQVLAHWAQYTPDRIALVYCDEELTCRELATSVESAAIALRAHLAEKGDRVVLLVGHNSIPWVIAYLAGLRIGAPPRCRRSAVG